MMEASFPELLRWLLLAVGVLVIIGVYWVSRRNDGGRGGTVVDSEQGVIAQGVSRRNDGGRGGTDKQTRRRVLPAFESGQPQDQPREQRSDLEVDAPEDETCAARATDVEDSQDADQDDGQPPLTQHQIPIPMDGTSKPGGDLKGRLLVLHVQARSKQSFSGADIMRVAEQAGLEQAAGSNGGFYQCRLGGGADAPGHEVLFYVANMFSPGVFKWSGMESFSTTGLSLFAQLPGALPPLETFDKLHECARRFAQGLQGAVCDESRSNLTSQTIQHIKEDLQNYAMGRGAHAQG